MERILIIDDDPDMCNVLSMMIAKMGYEPTVARTLEQGRTLALGEDYDIIMLDLDLPDGNGLQIIREILKASSSPEVIILTGTGDAQSAELAFKYGAWDFLEKPATFAELRLNLTRALKYHQEKGLAKTGLILNCGDIIGRSVSLHACLEDVARAAATDASVLITGETGTGKELFARAIHNNSRRAAGNFVTVDCGALPDTLAGSTLFGHEKGAFTGAERRQEGLIQQTEGGTLFLDEIGDLPMNIQISLLRTLQERRVRLLGGRHEIPVDFRLVSATNRSLEQMVAGNTFREDLLFRIRAMEIHLPPLRERKQDIAAIAIHKVQEMGLRYNLGLKGLSPEFLEKLTEFPWPGNVRELTNVLEYALGASKQDPILVPKHLPLDYRMAPKDPNAIPPNTTPDVVNHLEDDSDRFPSWPEYRDQAEKDYLDRLMTRAGGNRAQACRLSGMSQSRLYDLLRKHDLPGFRP